jgi:hypothetical protein
MCQCGVRGVSLTSARMIPEMLGGALDAAFPSVHDAVVRVVAEDIRAGGYDALARWCAAGSLPERFKVAEVTVEKKVTAEGREYQPDIAVWHSEGGRVELEVVNTHPPDAGRLEAAWCAGHFVLTLGIRDVVEKLVFSEARGVVPDDETLRALLGQRKFRLYGDTGGARETAYVAWRDLNLSAYAMELRAELRAAYWEDRRSVVSILADICCGCMGSDIPFEHGDTRAMRGIHRMFRALMRAAEGDSENVFPARSRHPGSSKQRWSIAAREFREALGHASAPHPDFVRVAAKADVFLDQFDRAHEPAGVRRLRYTLAAVWYCRKKHLAESADMANSLIGFGHPKGGKHRRMPLAATEQGIK